jgi:predicted phosphoribosyltransferase
VRRAPYADRVEAGAALADALGHLAGRDGLLVLGLPRGGVPVAAVVAKRLRAALDVLLVRKLGLPQQPELAMGAIAAVGGAVEVVRNPDVLTSAKVAATDFEAVRERELRTLADRERAYRRGRPAAPIEGRTVIVADDGLATGATMRAALTAVRRQHPQWLVAAAPIGARATCAQLAVEADEVVCPWLPDPFRAVGQGYLDFSATTDDEVIRLLAE